MKLNRIIETCLYSRNLERSERFYSETLGLNLIRKEENRHLFYRCGNTMLLIFNPIHTNQEQTYVNGNKIPLHGTTGAAHIAFSVERNQFKSWKSHLKEKGIEIESSVKWPGGLKSIYFRDPAGNSLEIIESGMWNIEE
ncbi:VOC family protein [Rhodohalobacter barkolensis]|uniref:Glyoxalase/bleomycin resistance/extradiol dioxygenase family protein n=1 Tax=Rhodohalobacter barkolensis TaxID=2053187 RepID=A0A2N0VJQ6_9BACT|nr:VOC family protein [Rhodohalobacter barkolensis]PKD44435.1 glyoxalase/bleomycin resistance/extradiol dioxygenase family protein [Rhodohalobacter barkolensis]